MNVMDIMKKILRWSDGADWRSWIVHAAISVPMVMILSLWMLLLMALHAFTPFNAAASGIVFHYLAREGEQIAHEVMSRIPSDLLHWLDHFMDVAGVTALLYGIAQWVQ